MARAKHHKQATHQRILETAAAAIRARGLAGIGIAELMQEAGLTHGGFYAHFESKDALIAEVLSLASGAARQAMSETAAAAPPGEALIAVADAYLTTRHREHPERGCVVAALGSEIAREPGAARQRLSDAIIARLDRLAELAPAGDDAGRRRQAIGAFAAMVGGLILARGVEDADAADRILADVRAFLRASLETPAGEKP
ncbi:MAG TPA: TetR/AcrR family transcriptional regulator [Stellaceae bacterium]|nr:TetR/AcrR family transcriptional regulator [Stellaceae bacterium]